MSLLFRFLLGHVLGDYVLQPLGLVLWKRRHIWGVLVHASIVTLCTAALFLPNLSPWWVSLLVLWVSHIVIDAGRVRIVKNSADKGLYLFLIDQGLHVLVILILWGVSINWQFELDTLLRQGLSWWDRTVVYLFGFISIVWIGPILELEAVTTLTPRRATANGQPQFLSMRIAMLDRLMGFIERLLGATLIMTGYFLPFPLVFLPRLIIQRSEWQASHWALGIKIATSALVALIVGLILWVLPL